jgi:hypothetical protein
VNQTEVGALWVRNGKAGEFWAGNINLTALAAAAKAAGQDPTKVQVTLFRNKFDTTKSGKPAPAFRILHDSWKPGGQQAPAQAYACPQLEPPAEDF